jgi:hypothetical protein
MLVACLAMAATALGGSRDSDRDRLPDRWEKRHHISTHVKSGRKDPDRDGLSNLGEFRAKTDPRDRDSDDDGLRDGAEHIGTVESFNDGVLTIALAGGGTVSGAVTDATELECENEDVTARASHDDDDRGDDDRGDDDDDTCPAGALAPGAKVEEAELELTADGPWFEEIELRN